MHLLFKMAFFLLLFSRLAMAYDSQDFAQEIGITAAHIENDQVYAQFAQHYKNILADAQQTRNWSSNEKQELLAKAASLVQFKKIQKTFQTCMKDSKYAKEYAHNILDWSSALKTEADPCAVTDSPLNLTQFNNDLKESIYKDLDQKIREVSSANIEKTKSYWRDVQKNNDVTAVAKELNSNLQDASKVNFSQGVELLMHTDILSKKYQKARDLQAKNQPLINENLIQNQDVNLAYQEVLGDLDTHAQYLQKLNQDANEKKYKENLKSLIKSNPAAVAQVLLNDPSKSSMFCELLLQIEKEESSAQFRDKVFFWGGMAVAGIALVGTGVGIGLLIAGTAASTTLVTAIGATTVLGVTGAGVDAVHSSNRAFESYSQAQILKSSYYSANGSLTQLNSANEKTQAAYSDMVTAGIDTVSILPFGAGWRLMTKASAAARTSSLTRAAASASEIEEQSMKAVAQTLREIQNDPKLAQILKNARGAVSEQDMGQFLGNFSNLSKAEKDQVIALMKKNPEKVDGAITKSLHEGGEACR